jgi:hypothetical protein
MPSDKRMTVARPLAEFSAAGNVAIQTCHLTRHRLINNKYLPFKVQIIINTFSTPQGMLVHPHFI